MQITVACAADRDEVRQLVSLVWTDDYVAECWDDWVSHPESGIPLVARLDERVVGIAYVRLLSERVAWLQALRVHPEARRKGVGSSLSQAALAQAKARGRQVARLLIDAENLASASMTEQAGFRQVLRLCKLHKDELAADGPTVVRPSLELLPALLQLAKDQGAEYWHSDWETHDLSLAALQQAAESGCLRVLKERPTAAVADVNAFDQDYDVNLPVGEPEALLSLMRGLEAEALSLGKQQIDVFLSDDSPLLPLLLERGGYQLLEGDGHAIWEYQL